ncbi:MAG: uroporphyrinogen-III C-methyltransferase [Gammaproteobacteria bacterium]
MSESKDKTPVPKKAMVKDTGSTPPPVVKQAAVKKKPVPPPSKPVPEKKPQPGNRGNSSAPFWLSLLSLAASIALGVAAFFFWNQQQQSLQGQDSVATRVDTKLQAVDTTIGQVKSGFDDLKATAEKKRDVINDKVEQLKENQRSQSDRISKLNALIGRSTQDWTLAEVEYLLRVASERTHLQRDVKTALVALENADQRLLELSDPGLASIRQQIADERGLLKRVPVIDREGLAASLATVLSRLDGLPISGQVYKALAKEGEADAAQAEDKASTKPPGLDWQSWEDWKKIPGQVGESLRKLVTIRQHDQPVHPMIQPGSETFLRQNLRLQIESARLALLREDAVFYQQSLDTAKTWINKFFAIDESDVQAMLEQLNELGSVQVHPVMPDISKSLQLLRKHLELSARVSASNDAPKETAVPEVVVPTPDQSNGQNP